MEQKITFEGDEPLGPHIYCWWLLRNGVTWEPIYVGKSEHGSWRRAQQHLTQKNRTRWANALKAYVNRGETLRVTILECLVGRLHEINDVERHYIKAFGRRGVEEHGALWNETEGGDGLSSADGKRVMNRPEVKAKFTGENNWMLGRTGELNPMFGIPQSGATRDALSTVNLGKRASDEVKAKSSERARVGRVKVAAIRAEGIFLHMSDRCHIYVKPESQFLRLNGQKGGWRNLSADDVITASSSEAAMIALGFNPMKNTPQAVLDAYADWKNGRSLEDRARRLKSENITKNKAKTAEARAFGAIMLKYGTLAWWLATPTQFAHFNLFNKAWNSFTADQLIGIATGDIDPKLLGFRLHDAPPLELHDKFVAAIKASNLYQLHPFKTF